MLREGPIPAAVQGVLEYLAGFLFIAAPFLLGFTGTGMATAAAIVLGICFLVLAATSQGPTGLARQVSPPVHALLDAVLAVLLIAAPFVLGFSGVATPRNLFLATGVLWLLVTIGSRYDRTGRTAPAPAARPAAPAAQSPAARPAAPAAQPAAPQAPARPADGRGGPDRATPVQAPAPTTGGSSAVRPGQQDDGRPGTVGPDAGSVGGGASRG